MDNKKRGKNLLINIITIIKSLCIVSIVICVILLFGINYLKIFILISFGVTVTSLIVEGIYSIFKRESILLKPFLHTRLKKIKKNYNDITLIVCENKTKKFIKKNIIYGKVLFYDSYASLEIIFKDEKVMQVVRFDYDSYTGIKSVEEMLAKNIKAVNVKKLSEEKSKVIFIGKGFKLEKQEVTDDDLIILLENYLKRRKPA